MKPCAKSAVLKDRKFLLAAAGACVLVWLILGHAARVWADEAVCEITMVKNTAWTARTHQAIKSTAAPGDLLMKGDSLEVKDGNIVQLSFDSNQENMLYIVGPTRLEISSNNEHPLELKEGKVFALLDNWPKNRTFKISTPTAIAAVRGTQFQIKSAASGTDVAVYRGAVKTSGRDAAGNPMGVSYTLTEGQSTSIPAAGMNPGKPEPLTADTAEIDAVRQEVTQAKSALKNRGFQSKISVSSDMEAFDAPKDGKGNRIVY